MEEEEEGSLRGLAAGDLCNGWALLLPQLSHREPLHTHRIWH